MKTCTIRKITHPFAPIIDCNSKVLVLGSVPSVKSVEQGFYYMNKYNRFWKIMSDILGVDMESMDSGAKTATLLDAGIALYDSVYKCEISGSKDSTVKVVEATNLDILTQGSNIQIVLCNGRLSYDTAVRYNPKWKDKFVLMPSTSPANAAISREKLREIWAKELEKYIICQ
ncbi:MAG: DNA-deoxyinosine glycosylase [Christensenellales bacterium]